MYCVPSFSAVRGCSVTALSICDGTVEVYTIEKEIAVLARQNNAVLM